MKKGKKEFQLTISWEKLKIETPLEGTEVSDNDTGITNV